MRNTKMRSEMVRKDACRQASALRRAAAIGTVLALLVGLDAGPAAAAPKPCGDFVHVGSVYSCNVTPLFGPPSHDCLTIRTSGGAGFEFDLPLVVGNPFTCGCGALGSVHPTLLSSPTSFICDSSDPQSGTPYGATGKVAAGGKKIIGGNAVAGGSSIWAFSCTLDPGCTP